MSCFSSGESGAVASISSNRERTFSRSAGLSRDSCARISVVLMTRHVIAGNGPGARFRLAPARHTSGACFEGGDDRTEFAADNRLDIELTRAGVEAALQRIGHHFER